MRFYIPRIDPYILALQGRAGRGERETETSFEVSIIIHLTDCDFFA